MTFPLDKKFWFVRTTDCPYSTTILKFYFAQGIMRTNSCSEDLDFLSNLIINNTISKYSLDVINVSLSASRLTMIMIIMVSIHFWLWFVNHIVTWTYSHSPTLGRPQGRRSLWRWETPQAKELPSTLSSSQLITLRVRCSWRAEG